MKTLLLMRHAKSSWKMKDIPDHDRTLNKRGRRDAPRMGQILLDRELIPQLILSSSALRARQTAEFVAETAGYCGEIAYSDDLYMAEAEGYIAALHNVPDTIERVMLIGHNPGLETLLQILSNQIEALPTAVVAHLVLPLDQWSLLNGNVAGELVDIWRPKELLDEEVEEKKGKGKAREKGKKK